MPSGEIAPRSIAFMFDGLRQAISSIRVAVDESPSHCNRETHGLRPTISVLEEELAGTTNDAAIELLVFVTDAL